MPPQFPTRDIRNLGLEAGNPAAFSSLSNSTARDISQNVPSEDVGQQVMQMLQRYQQFGQNQLYGAQQEQVNRTFNTPQSLIGASPAQQESARSAAVGALEPTIGGARDLISQVQGTIKNWEALDAKRATEGERVIEGMIKYWKGSDIVAYCQEHPQECSRVEKESHYPRGFLSRSGMKSMQEEKLQLQQAKQAGAGSTSLDQDTINLMAQTYLTTGQIPSLGFGTAGAMQRGQIFKRAAEIAKQQGLGGSDIAANKAAFNSYQSALRTQQTQYGGAKTSLRTLDKQLGLVEQFSKKVGRTGSPVVNKYLLYLKGQYAGDADTQALQNAIQTASYEFAKILSGSAASIAGATVSSAQDAQHLINSNMTTGQIQTIINLMRKESNFRLTSQQNTIKDIQDEIKNLGGQQRDVTGTIRVREKSSGKTGTLPENEFDSNKYDKL